MADSYTEERAQRARELVEN